MTEAQIIQSIQQFIVTNGNNEITAAVLRPILEEMVKQPNSLIGNINSLETSNKTTLVAAINSLIAAAGAGGVKIREGTTDPNVNPPANYELGDFYRLLVDGATAAYFVYTGLEWVQLKTPSEAVYKGINTATVSYVVKEDDYAVVYLGTAPATFTLPSAGSSFGRELRLVNRTAHQITLNVNYYASYANQINYVPANSVVVLHSFGTLWHKTN